MVCGSCQVAEKCIFLWVGLCIWALFRGRGMADIKIMEINSLWKNVCRQELKVMYRRLKHIAEMNG